MSGSVVLRLPERVVAAALACVVAVGMMSVPAVRPSAMPAMPATAPSPPRPGAPALTMLAEPPALATGRLPTPAPAVAPPARAGRSAPQPRVAAAERDRVEQALDSLGYPWQEVGYAIRFVPYTGGLLGLADPATRTITVFVKPRQSVQSLRVVLAHEIGHALDDRLGTDALRARYLDIRGIAPETPWFPCLGCDDVASPAGDFAETFAAWLVGPTHFRSRLAAPPGAAQLEQLAPLFAPPSARAQAPPEVAVAPPAPAPRPSPSPSPSPDLLDVLPG